MLIVNIESQEEYMVCSGRGRPWHCWDAEWSGGDVDRGRGGGKFGKFADNRVGGGGGFIN
jgi:hypothetical protein